MQEREAKLTSLLIKRLEPYVQGQKESFEKSLQAEAHKLADSTFGGPMLKTIGQVPLSLHALFCATQQHIQVCQLSLLMVLHDLVSVASLQKLHLIL